MAPAAGRASQRGYWAYVGRVAQRMRQLPPANPNYCGADRSTTRHVVVSQTSLQDRVHGPKVVRVAPRTEFWRGTRCLVDLSREEVRGALLRRPVQPRNDKVKIQMIGGESTKHWDYLCPAPQRAVRLCSFVGSVIKVNFGGCDSIVSTAI